MAAWSNDAPQPVIRGVALFASCRETSRDVVRGRGLLELRLVAGEARRGHRLELAVGRVLVAGIAIHRGVRARQRETVVVLLNLLDRNLPSADGVALLAIRTQLTLVNVGVTVLAALPDVGKHRLDVALRARHILVQAPQRVASLVVIELGDGADRLPALGSVAILTWNIQIAVRTARAGMALRLPTHGEPRKQQ